jgi:hypothetical protein
MSCRTSVRLKQSPDRISTATPSEQSDVSPRIVAVFRRDDTLCHSRCGRSLALQGVRGLIEADFYCYTCLAHVSLPIAVLDSVPVERGSVTVAAFGRS